MTLRALYLNTSLKPGTEESNTTGLINESRKILDAEGVLTEELRVADYNVSFGMEPDMGNGDQWPEVFEKIKAADIFVIGTPIWQGEVSSVAKLVLERLDACGSETNEKGQPVYYNAVSGAIITGNEDGGKQAAKTILFILQHIGFTIPPNAEAYWVGEAGPGPSYLEAGRDSEFTHKNIRIMSHNLVHFARLFQEHPIPAKGNTE